MKLRQLLKLEKVVERILREDELARNDDCYLILRVVEEIDPKAPWKSFQTVMMHGKENGLSFESITRCRRKVKRKYPELTDKETESARQKEQLEYMDYANHIPFMENTMDDLEKLTIKGN